MWHCSKRRWPTISIMPPPFRTVRVRRRTRFHRGSSYDLACCRDNTTGRLTLLGIVVTRLGWFVFAIPSSGTRRSPHACPPLVIRPTLRLPLRLVGRGLRPFRPPASAPGSALVPFQPTRSTDLGPRGSPRRSCGARGGASCGSRTGRASRVRTKSRRATCGTRPGLAPPDPPRLPT